MCNIRFISEYLLSEEETIARSIERVKEKFYDQESSDSGEEAESAENHQSGGSKVGSTALININSEKRLIKSEIDPTVERYLSREYRGLDPTIPDNHDTAIHTGLFGTSTGYIKYNPTAAADAAEKNPIDKALDT